MPWETLQRRGGSVSRVLAATIIAGMVLSQRPAAAQCPLQGAVEAPATRDVFVGALAPGYDIGVDTDKMERAWLTCLGDDCPDCCRMALPPGQLWGAIFVTVGTPAPPPRPARDFRGYERMLLDLRGEHGGEHVQVGVKDACDPDDGTEIKIDVGPLTTDWQPVAIDLERFTSADVGQLYVLSEFVFDSSPGVEDARTVAFRNVRFAFGCGDADGSGSVTVSDGVQLLRGAAELDSGCTDDVCDVDGSGSVSITDAVNVLRAAAGIAVDLRCAPAQ